MTPVGFEPTQLALVELESTPLDHSGKVSLMVSADRMVVRSQLTNIRSPVAPTRVSNVSGRWVMRSGPKPTAHVQHLAHQLAGYGQHVRCMAPCGPGIERTMVSKI